MMFLQFFVWGSWYVTAGTFVPSWGWPQSTTGWVYSAGPIAALISPLFLGLVADRFFQSQRVLAVMHLLGAVLMLNFIPGAIEAKNAYMAYMMMPASIDAAGDLDLQCTDIMLELQFLKSGRNGLGDRN